MALARRARGASTLAYVAPRARRVRASASSPRSLAAVYPGLWVNDLVATSESPAMLLLAVVLLLVLRYRRAPTTRRLVLLGLTLGLLALDRAELSVLGLLLAVPAIVAVARRSAAPLATAVARASSSSGSLAVLRRRAVERVQPGALPPDRAHLDGPRPDARRRELPAELLRAAHRATTARPASCRSSTRSSAAIRTGRTRPCRTASTATRLTYAVHHWHRWPVVAVMRELWLWSLWRPGWTVSHRRLLHRATPRGSRGPRSSRSGCSRRSPSTGSSSRGDAGSRVAPLVTLVAFTAAIGLLVVGNLRYRIPAELAWVLLGAIAIDRLALRDARRSSGAGRRRRQSAGAGATGR